MLENLTWGAEIEIADWDILKYGNKMEEATGAKVCSREIAIINSSGVSKEMIEKGEITLEDLGVPYENLSKPVIIK